MASVKILVKHIESDRIALMEVRDDEPVQITKAALKEYGYALVDDHEAALKRVYAQARPRRSVVGFRPTSAHLRP